MITAKYIINTTDIPVSEVIWFRFFWHALLSLLIFSPLALPRLISTRKPAHQWMRALFMLGATAFNFVALRYLQLDQTITIFFLTPLIVAALAGPLLGEWVGWHRLLAIITGFRHLNEVLTNIYRVNHKLLKIGIGELITGLNLFAVVIIFRGEDLILSLLVAMLLSEILRLIIYLIHPPFKFLFSLEFSIIKKLFPNRIRNRLSNSFY